MAILDRNAQFKLELIRIELEMLDQKYLDDKRTRPNAGYILEPTMQPRNITVNVCNHVEQKKIRLLLLSFLRPRFQITEKKTPTRN